MAGRPRTRAKRAMEEEAKKNGGPLLTATRTEPKYQYLADIYAEKYNTFNALRQAMVQNGIVEHGINPYEVIQRAIDDTTTDYLLLRRAIDKDTHGDPNLLVEHPLYDYMEHMREAMVRYATFATQYDIQKRQLKLSETRVALLAHSLREVLTQMGLSPDQVRQVPRLLIAQVEADQPKQNTHLKTTGQQRLNPQKALAMAEILHHDADVEIIDQDEPS